MPDELGIHAFLHLEPEKGPAIEGEAMDSVHKGEIQVVSFGFGVTNKKSSSVGDGDTKPDFQEINMQIVPSKASPALMLATARGDHFKRATLSLRKHGASKTNADYMQLQLSDVYISSHTWSASGPTPTENITLSFMTIDFYYAQQDTDGTLKNPVKRAWSVGDNKDTPSALPFTKK